MSWCHTCSFCACVGVIYEACLTISSCSPPHLPSLWAAAAMPAWTCYVLRGLRVTQELMNQTLHCLRTPCGGLSRLETFALQAILASLSAGAGVRAGTGRARCLTRALLDE